MVDDGVSFQSGDLGSDVLQTELEPLVEGDVALDQLEERGFGDETIPKNIRNKN